MLENYIEQGKGNPAVGGGCILKRVGLTEKVEDAKKIGNVASQRKKSSR